MTAGGERVAVLNMEDRMEPSFRQQEIQLRFLCPSDVGQVRKLCSEWFPIKYPDSWYKDITSTSRFYSLAATYRSRIVGLIVAELKPRAKLKKEDRDILASGYPPGIHVAYILSLGVVETFRRHGIASLMLESLLFYLTSKEHASCKAVYLHVLAANCVAIQFYERHNFQPHSFLPFYYCIQGRGLDKGDKGDELLPMQQVPPLHVTDVVQGKGKSSYLGNGAVTGVCRALLKNTLISSK